MQWKELDIALSTFEKIRSNFPALSMHLDLHHAHVDAAMDIPAQSGLYFDVHLDFQNGDELTLSASKCWYEWFPCTNPEKVDRYIEAVSGLLSGEFRLVEHWRGRRVVMTQLQRPNGRDWKGVATSFNSSAIIPWPPKTLRIVQNNSSPTHPA